MKLLSHPLRFPLLAAAALFCLNCAASAQTGSLIPLPFVSTVAGLAAGSGNTLCATDIPNQSGQNIGDGCLPTQATLVSLYDVQSDAAGNVYTSENGANADIRVVYRGGATLTAVLTAASAGITNFTPIPGRIYTLAGGTAAALTAVSKIYYCGNVSGGQQALDSQGNGCPAAQSYLKPRGMAIDRNGNIFTTNTGGGNGVRVIYAGGAQVANLITLENPTVTAPKVGYIYKLSGQSTANYSGDGGLASAAAFVQIRYIAVDSNGNLYISDGTTQSTSGGNTIEAAANNVREINGTTGIITTFAGEDNCTYVAATGCPYGSSGDGGPATSALLSTPYALFVDGSNNLYIADYYNGKVRVVYQGGTIAGISSPVVGDIYTYAGGGTSTANGSIAQQVKFGLLYVGGIDPAGNIYAEDSTSKVMWRFDAKTAVGNIIAGGGPSGTTRPAAFCSGTSGPVSTDDYGDGCPGPQAALVDTGTIAFDPSGNFYTAENGNAIVRELSYNNQFGSTSDGTATTQTLAFEALAATTLTGETFTLEGTATSEYADTGGDTCALTGPLTPATICVYNVAFNPAHAGQRQGSLALTTATGPAVSEFLSGTGEASDIAIDTGTKSTLGTGLAPAGVATDLLGNVYVSDTTGNRVLKGPSNGTTLTALVTGLNKPAGIAVDGFGDIYIADSGNNRVLETSSSGATITSLGSGLSAPKGVAVDSLGNIYVADTGNNRIEQLFANGNQTTLPIVGLSAPTQLALDAAGDLFIVDSGNKRIVEYASGAQSVVTLDAGVAPTGVAVAPSGTIYVADSTGLRVLAYAPGVSTGNILLTGLTTPVALASDSDANLFIADSSATGAIELRRSLGDIAFPLTNVGQSTTQSISVSNVGNAALDFPSAPLTSMSGSALFTVASSTSNGCAVGTNYAAGGDCNFTASFKPLVTGTYSATVAFNTNATNTGTVSAVLSGKGLLLTTTNTTLNITSPTGTIYYGQAVTLSAVMTPTTTTTTPTGTFTFTIDGKTQSPVSVGNGSTTLTLSTLTAAAHSVSVTYSGDGTYASSASTSNFTVNQAITTTTLSVAPVNNSGALSLLFTASVKSSTATGETGSVKFYAGTVLLGSGTVNSSGIATYSSSSLSFASNVLTAVYSGDANFAGSTSPAFSTGGGDFAIGSASTALATSQGGVANISFTIASLYGGAGTLTPTCTGLPANTVCRFQPGAIVLSSTPQTEAILIYTNVQSTLASNERPSTAGRIAFALGLPLGLGLLVFRRRLRLGMFALLLVGVSLATGLSGCGNGTNAADSNKGLTTAAGTYPINIVFTGSNGITATHSVSVTLTVIADSGSF